MGLDFSKTTTAAAPAATVVPDTKDEIAVVEQYDIVADRESSHLERRLQKKFRKHRMSC